MFLFRTDLENLALHVLLTNGFSAVNGYRQNERSNDSSPNSNCFQLKRLIIHNTFFSNETVNQERNMYRSSSVYNKSSPNSSEQLYRWFLMWDDYKRWTISLDITFHNTLIDDSYELFVDYCDLFISCLNSHSDGTHSLQRIHWWASDAIHFPKSVAMNQNIQLHLGWP